MTSTIKEKRLNILYVGILAIPIADILKGKTEDEITGWPAYFQPVYRLIRAGHNVEFAITSSLSQMNIKVDWFKADQIVANIYIDKDKLLRLNKLFRVMYIARSRFKLFLAVLRNTMKKRYDFIYCQDTAGISGNILANLLSIPCGMRFYGDTFYLHGRTYTKHEYIMDCGKLKFFLSSPLTYIAHKMKKSFILTTDDGTDGDITYDLLKPKREKYNFYYWRSGVNKTPPILDEAFLHRISGMMYICYPARIDNIKRQDRIIRVLKILHQRQIKMHAILLGQVCNTAFFDYLNRLIKDSMMEEYVHFLGAVSQNDVKLYAVNAVANVLVSDSSNRGNVFFELFSIGSPIIALNDGSLDGYIQTGDNGFLADDEEEIAKYVSVLMDENNRTRICSKAIMDSSKTVLNLDERFDLEVQLIEANAKREKVFFPKKI